MMEPRRNPPVLGIIGAGQLARMMLQAAVSLDLRVRLLAARPDDAAARVWPDVTVGSPDSLDVLRAFASGCDLLTFDHELIDPAHMAALESEGHVLRPSASAAVYAQDKGAQRARFAALGLPVPAHRPVSSIEEIEAFARVHGWPVVAKAQRGGYDGRGVWILDGPVDAARLIFECATAGLELIAEEHLSIDREIAALVARRSGGDAVAYPVVETVQRDGICHEVIAPAAIATPQARTAVALARSVAEAVGAVGILAVELFVVGGRLLVNEIALRPHNSGHYTIEGCVTSQFENHLRAVLDLPLGSTELVAPAVVMSSICDGERAASSTDALAAALTVPGAHVHLYGREPRPGRTIGHVTVTGSDVELARAGSTRAAALLAGTVGAEVRA